MRVSAQQLGLATSQGISEVRSGAKALSNFLVAAAGRVGDHERSVLPVSLGMTPNRCINWLRHGCATLGCLTLIAGALGHAVSGIAHADAVENGDFETGDLSGWAVFTTANGTLGGAGFPIVFDFDIAGEGSANKSAGFKVGQRLYKGMGSEPEGGGIYQTITLGAGVVTVAADIAASYSSQRHARNLSGGFFELILDEQVLDRYDFGPIAAGTTERWKLTGPASVTQGPHQIRLRITRPVVAKTGTPAPFQFVDNVTVTGTPAP